MDMTKLPLYLAGGVGLLFAIVVAVYMSLRKKMMGKNTKYIAQLTQRYKTKCI